MAAACRRRSTRTECNECRTSNWSFRKPRKRLSGIHDHRPRKPRIVGVHGFRLSRCVLGRNDGDRGAIMDVINVDYDGMIPNNVGLNQDIRVRKALEKWHPGYLDWWQDMGPEGFQESLVYLRTAVSVDPKGWAKFDYVRMPEYKWGILLAPQVSERKIGFGAHMGEKAWQEVPGEYRAMLLRLIVMQGDTEPASAAPSRQDRAVALRHAQSVPGERRGRLPSVGDGLSAAEIFRRRRPRGGRGIAAAPLRRPRHAAHARRLQREDAGLAVVLHVHHL